MYVQHKSTKPNLKTREVNQRGVKREMNIERNQTGKNCSSLIRQNSSKLYNILSWNREHCTAEKLMTELQTLL